MTELTEEYVRQIAVLSQLDLSDSEVTFYQHYLTRVLGYMDHIRQLELDASFDEVTLPHGLERPDTPASSSIDIAAVSASAPDMVATSFRVPRIIES